MLAYLLLFCTIIIFLFFFLILGKEWYAPYSLYCIPFIVVILIGALNQSFWKYTINETTFFSFSLSILFFCLGCIFSKALKKNTGKQFLIPKYELIISDKKLTVILIITIITFVYYAFSIYSWGVSHGRSFSSSINYIMMVSKFNLDAETMHKSIILKFLVVFVEILPYILSYWIARVLVNKEKINLKLLVLSFIMCEASLFLTGSRGPMVECIIALIVSIGTVYYSKTHKKFFDNKLTFKIVSAIAIVFVAFFEILPLMGRQETASNIVDSIYQYLGSQIYNFNYFIEHSDQHSTGFLANTLNALYDDLNSYFGISVYSLDKKVSGYFITSSNGHEMGNVFSCLLAYYVDVGIFGICIMSMISGIISENIFLNIKGKNINAVSYPLYLYLSINLVFCYFANRFFSNIVNIRFVIKVIYIILVYIYTTNSKVSKKFFLKF